MTTYDLIVVTAAGLTNQHTHTIKTRFHAKGWKLSEKSYRRGIRAICCAGVGVTLKWHRMQFPSGSKSQQKSRTSVLASELEASRREQPGATRSSQEQPGATRSSQEQPGVARSSQEYPGAAREQHPAAARSTQIQKLTASSKHR